MRDFQRPGRSTVHATGAMAATSHPLATAATLRMLTNGGNAVDAAVAAAAVLGVVEPEQAGVGGDLFALISPKGSGEVIALDAAGTAPAAATADWYTARGFAGIPFDGPHSVTVGRTDRWLRDRLLAPVPSEKCYPEIRRTASSANRSGLSILSPGYGESVP
jgi:gamma-glutamyltranspeptidase/glutathione hydrolase